MTNSQSMQRDTFEDKFGNNIAARLTESTQQLPHDISERLKVARLQALSKRKVVKLQTADSVTGNGSAASLHLGGHDGGLWVRIASVLPLIALIAGLMAIAVIAEDSRTDDIASIDAELLTDELPPDAYTDPGFAQFLRVHRND